MRKKIVIAALILTVLVIAVILQPSPGYSLSRVDPTLRGLAMPYQSVNLVNWSDGTIGIRILDKDGRRLKLALPVSSSAGSPSYRRLFVEAESPGNSAVEVAVEVVFSEDTRRLLLATLEQYRAFSDSTDVVLIRLRGALRDYAHLYGNTVVHAIKEAVAR